MDGMTINHIVSIDHGSYKTMEKQFIQPKALNFTRPPGPPADTNGVSGFGGASPTPMPPPEETNAILAWIQESRFWLEK
jgi:hypothetical protein